MITENKQADLNKMQVSIEQMMELAVGQAQSWAALSKKEQVMAWGEWAMMPERERCFHQFDRVLQTIEGVA